MLTSQSGPIAGIAVRNLLSGLSHFPFQCQTERRGCEIVRRSERRRSKLKGDCPIVRCYPPQLAPISEFPYKLYWHVVVIFCVSLAHATAFPASQRCTHHFFLAWIRS